MLRFRFLHALLIYAICAAGLLPHVLWYANNPDTFQYLALAGRYADGSFLNVINAYWSPLIIWLLIVPIKIFGSGVIAFKALQICIGAFGLFGWHRLLRIAPVDRSAQVILLFAAIPFLLVYGLLMLTADLLFLCIAFHILAFSIKENVLSSSGKAIMFGIMGAFWYFSKAFALPLFFALLIVVFLIEKRRNSLHPAARHIALAAVACGLLIAPWVLAMSNKYGYFTISEAARFNQTVEVAPMPGEIKKMPLLTDGPHMPPPGAISPWESPGDVMKLTPLRPWTDPQRYIQLIKRNLLTIYYHDIQRQLGTPFLILLCIAFIFHGRTILQERSIMIPLLLMLALNLGYALILVHDRYIWLNTFIMLLLSAQLLHLIFSKKPAVSATMLVLLVLLSIKRPVKQIFFTGDVDMSAKTLLRSLATPIATLERTYHPDHARMDAIDKLRGLNLKGAMASLQNDDPVRHAYSSSLHIAYELGLTYHGEVLKDLPLEEQLHQLREHHIRYFAVWKKAPWSAGELLIDPDPPAPRVYQLN